MSLASNAERVIMAADMTITVKKTKFEAVQRGNRSRIELKWLVAVHSEVKKSGCWYSGLVGGCLRRSEEEVWLLEVGAG